MSCVLFGFGYLCIGAIWAAVWNRWLAGWLERGERGMILGQILAWPVLLVVEVIIFLGEFDR